MNLLIEHSLPMFIVLVLILGGGAAFLAGRAIAKGWQPLSLLIAYMFPFTAGLRFLQYALFNDEKLGTPNLTSGYYFITDFIILTLIAWAGYQSTKATKMVSQYPWLYEKTGLFGWRSKS
jgi:hypothetical protein